MKYFLENFTVQKHATCIFDLSPVSPKGEKQFALYTVNRCIGVSSALCVQVHTEICRWQ